MSDAPIIIERLVKDFGSTRAVNDASLTAEAGTVLGLLGPNGSGKTTIVRMLATLLEPTSGVARVGGFDVVRHPQQVRRVIGLAGQYAAIDDLLTGTENLTMVARLYGMNRATARARARELITRFDLDDARDRIAKTYSGGMRRRLDLAASLVAAPPILFLDEPTTGLDPRSRIGMWDVIAGLVDDGTTVLLTTQYLEEADRLADTVVVLDRGAVIASGTPDELKSRVGGLALEIQPRDIAGSAVIARALNTSPASATGDQTSVVRLPLSNDPRELARSLEALAAAGVTMRDIELTRPTMDDVFLDLTGHPEVAHEQEPAR